MAEQKKFVPFVASETVMSEFTARALVIGLFMCVILGAANAYLGLKAGMTIAATYPAAVIGMALIKLLKGSVLEENFSRTVGSIGESVAAGACFTIPAFAISGIWPEFFTQGNYITSTLIMVAGGVLGIMFVALLRRVMVEDAELPFPESVAAAEIHKTGRTGGTGTTFLFGAMGMGGAIQALCQVSLFATAWEKFVSFAKVSIGLKTSGTATAQGGILLSSPGISPAFMGVGYIIGPKLASLNFSGGLMAWGLMVPIITYFLAPSMPGLSAESDWAALSVNVWKFIVRPIAIGGMLMGACYTLFKMRKSLIAGIARSVGDVKKAATGEVTHERINHDLSFPVIMLGILGAAVATFLITWMIFKTSVMVAAVASVVMIIAGFFFAAVSGYLVGIIGSSNNPISGLTLTALVVTALVMVILGVHGQEGVAAVLGVAAIVCVSAAVAGEMLQDLKAGHILGGTPWKMQIGDLVGVVVAAVVMFLPLVVLHVGDINDAVSKRVDGLQVVTAYTAAPQGAVFAPAADPSRAVVLVTTLGEIRNLSEDKNFLEGPTTVAAYALGPDPVTFINAKQYQETLKANGEAEAARYTLWKADLDQVRNLAKDKAYRTPPRPVEAYKNGDRYLAKAEYEQIEDAALKAKYQPVTLTIDEVQKLTPDQQKGALGLDAGFGGKAIPAPQAGLMAMLSRGIVEGKMAWPLIIVGMLMGLALILMQVRSPMLVSVGMYLPLETTFAIFLGGLIKGVMDMISQKRKFNDAQRVRSENVGILIAAGLIAGEALIGLVFAALKFFKVDYDLTPGVDPGHFFISLILLGAIALVLVVVPQRNAGSPDEPPPPSANF